LNESPALRIALIDRITKSIGPLWIPGLILVVVLWFKPQALESLSRLGVRPQMLFYSVGAAGLLLSWRFNRSRILLALLSLLMSYAFLETFTGKGRAVDVTTASMVVGGILSINFLVIAFMPERGVLSSVGRLAVLLMSAEIALVLLLIAVPALSSYVGQIRYYGALKAMSWTPLSIVTLSMAGATSLVLLIRTLLSRSAIDGGLLVAMLAALAGLHFIGVSKAEALYFATAALIMQATIIQDSHARVYFDELTNLPGRRALDEQMMRLGRRYVIAMIDIDHFKSFNDRFGHDVGDQALRFVASQLARARGRAKIFRYGGEEFTLLFPGKTMDEALPFIEQIRERVENTPFVIRGISRPKQKPKIQTEKSKKTRELLTISVGAAERSANQRTPQEVLKVADKKLYKAKSGGRNQTVH
jgi:diguanylate cyclase (GGDEF)-like protein